MTWRVALLSASDSGSRGEREDTSAQVIRELVEEELSGEIVEYRIVPDDSDEISAALVEMAEYNKAHLVLTTGGVGTKKRDVTPEATMRVIDRSLPGIPEVLRASMISKTPEMILFRGVAGMHGNTLIINLPATPRAVSDGLSAILPGLAEVLGQLLDDQ